MRFCLMILSAGLVLLSGGCVSNPERYGMGCVGETLTDHAELLVDETWIDPDGERQVSQEIFDNVFSIIGEAGEFILIDFFLVNDFLYEPGPGLRPLSRELTDCILSVRARDPEIPIVFITDPINTAYGSTPSAYFEAMEEAGVFVVWTDLDRLRDSNPLYSKPWRLLVKPWGVGPGSIFANPLSDGRMSMRSMLKLLNFKANHRKLLATDKTLLVTSGNPHSGSSAHWNVALRFDGAGMDLGIAAESAVLRLSGTGPLDEILGRTDAGHPGPSGGGMQLELLTERRIKERVLELLEGAEPGFRIDLAMFYLSDRQVIRAIIDSKKRGCDVRVILDPNKDAFGRTKNGVPNRQTAAKLVGAGVPLRWADTRGEQFHVKMLYVQQADGTGVLVLGSCNFTRRNMENYNAECDAALTAPEGAEALIRARETFDRWWSNPGGRSYTADYAAYEDTALRRRFQAWFMETTGIGSF